MGNAGELSTHIQTLLGGSTSKRLVQLTNQNDNSAITIDTTVLESACNFAIGTFDIRSGILSDTSTPNYGHLQVLFEGVMFFLTRAAGLDTGYVANYERAFFAGLKALRDSAYAEATTGNPLQRTTQKQGARPDSDRNNIVFKSDRYVSNTSVDSSEYWST